MEEVRVELMALGMQFENCGSLCFPVTGLLVYMGIGVELEQEGLDITLVLDGQKPRLEILSEGQLLVAVSLAWWISAYSTA